MAAERRDQALLIPLGSFTLVALVGYGLFAARPGLVPMDRPWMIRFYQHSFEFMAQGHIVIALLALTLVLFRAARFRWMVSLGAVGTIAFLSEWIGTGYGLPFGPYSYTGLLGYRIGGRVPWSIPLSWFVMALPAYLIAARRVEAASRAKRVVLGAALLTIWDLALDPAMSHLTAYWRWEEAGAYYGMPAINLVGWFVTGAVLMGVFEFTGTREWSGPVTTRWLVGFYGLVLAMPIGMCALAGAWGAVAATAIALLTWTAATASGARVNVAMRREVPT